MTCSIVVIPGLVPGIHALVTEGGEVDRPGAQTSVRSLRKADYYVRHDGVR